MVGQEEVETMSKELAAAMLTQVYFQSSPTAAHRVNQEVQADPAKGAAPAEGGIATVVTTYAKVLQMMDKLVPAK
jgi:hypothetical protein